MVSTKVRDDISSCVLRVHARLEKDGRIVRRLLAIAHVLDGMRREDAARSSGMTRQILRDWIVRYNADGIAGLRDRPSGRTKSRLSTKQESALKALVLKEPDTGRIRWRLVDLQAEIQKRFNISYHERSVGKILRRLNFVHISVRPVHPQTDAQAQEDFKKTSRTI